MTEGSHVSEGSKSFYTWVSVNDKCDDAVAEAYFINTTMSILKGPQSTPQQTKHNRREPSSNKLATTRTLTPTLTTTRKCATT